MVAKAARMEQRDVRVGLKANVVAAAEIVARQRGVRFAELLEEALVRELERASRQAKTPNRADEQLLGPLRVLLAQDFAEARSWADLNGRLLRKGFRLREAGGGLALHSHPQDARLCKASELGHAYRGLMRRYGTPFPGSRAAPPKQAPKPPAPVQDDGMVIEPW